MSRKAWILFTLTSTIWGSSFLLIRLAVANLTPQTVVFGRSLMGAALLAPIALRTGSLRGLRSQVAVVASVALLDVAVPQFLTAWSEQRITSSLAGILTASDPLFV